MSDNLKEMQAAFEEWAGYSPTFNPSAWKAWQAAIASQQEAHDAEIAKLKEEYDHLEQIANDLQETCDNQALQLSAANAAFAMKNEALEFYANGHHFVQHQDVWESVSGEPENFLEDENNTATIEDGSVAKHALSASPQQVSEWEAKKQAQWNEESNSLIGQQDIQIGLLQRQVAMLRNTVAAVEVVGMHYEESSNIYFTCPECEFNKAPTSQSVKHAKDCMVQNALSNTQATAEQFIAECEQRGAEQFKQLLLEASKAVVHPHIEGVFAVYQSRATSKKAG